MEVKHRIGPENPYVKGLKKYGSQIMKLLKNKENIQKQINQTIDWVENCFRKYDTVQLLGSLGLYLLDNLLDTQTIITCTGIDEFVRNRFSLNTVYKVTEGSIELVTEGLNESRN